MSLLDPMMIGTIGLVALTVLVALGVHIAFAMFAISFLGILFVSGPTAALGILAWTPFSVVSSWTFAAIPLFIIMGELSGSAGFTGDVFRTAKNWVGSFPGGLAMAGTVGCAIFSAASGSALACTAVMGRIIVPELRKSGYDPGLAAGSVAAAATLDPLIPPSIPLVLFGLLTGESVAKLLIAGIIPGIVSALIYLVMITIRARLNPTLAPPIPPVSWRERLVSLKGVLGILLIGFVVMGSLYAGVSTPTEAGAIGGLMALAATFVLKRFTVSLHSLWETLIETTRTSSKIFIIILAATIFSRFLVITRLTPMITSSLVQFTTSPYIFILLMFIFSWAAFLNPSV
jgi:C4-dicarboxylate transporter DctM subunit